MTTLASSFLTSSGGEISSSVSTSSPSDDSINTPITSELFTISPTFLTIFVKTPFVGATTSNTTLSVSISAMTSSCSTFSPSFFSQFATVPSATDSGKVGDLISIVIFYSKASLTIFACCSRCNFIIPTAGAAAAGLLMSLICFLLSSNLSKTLCILCLWLNQAP